MVGKMKQTIDCYKFIVKAKDMQTFKENALSTLRFCKIRDNKPDLFVTENPNYNEYKNSISKIKSEDWAWKNLKNAKGYNVSSPLHQNPDDLVNVYVLKTPKIIKAYNKKFFGFIDKLNAIKDTFKAFKQKNQFYKTLENRWNPNYFDKAEGDFLMEHKLNEISDNRFQKFLKKANVREIEYTPKSNWYNK